jgi:Asp-tRNA(Asn)/Glu-tRNA(Gln) amidotransferase A subunit family amidase
VFTRSVPDAAFLAAILSEEEKSDSYAGGKKPVISRDIASMSGAPRLAAFRSPVWHMADRDAQEHFISQIKRLRAAGAFVEESELPRSFEQAHAVHRTIMYAEGAAVFADLQRLQRGRLSPRLNNLIDEGLTIKQSALKEAFEQKKNLAGEMDNLLKGFDAAATPPATGEAPADLTQTGDPAFCTIWSLCGVPAITIPAGLGPQGIPLGLQITGRKSADNRLLSVAKWCDEAIGWPRRIAGS